MDLNAEDHELQMAIMQSMGGTGSGSSSKNQSTFSFENEWNDPAFIEQQKALEEQLKKQSRRWHLQWSCSQILKLLTTAITVLTFALSVGGGLTMDICRWLVYWMFKSIIICYVPETIETHKGVKDGSAEGSCAIWGGRDSLRDWRKIWSHQADRIRSIWSCGFCARPLKK